MRALAAAGAVGAVVLAGGCSDGQGNVGQVVPTPKATVVIRDGAYQPRTVRIAVGSRVTWVNRDTYPVTVETEGVSFFAYDRDQLDRENRFDLHTLDIGEAESVHFDAPGRYRYHSSFDPGMTGTVVVTRPEGRPD